MKKDFLTFADLKTAEIFALIDRAIALKKLCKKNRCPKALQHKTLAMIFEKSSTRTRVSFEVGAIKLGGSAVYLSTQDSQLGRGESYEDTARVLSRYVDIIMMRTFAHEALQKFASAATVPVINGLTDLHHPCQVLADLVTLKEKRGDIKKLQVAWIGDGNNMTHSWMEAADRLGFVLRIATPKGYQVEPSQLKALAHPERVRVCKTPEEAVKNCDVINTDTWFSMGQEVSDEKRQAFAAYQVNAKLVGQANSKALVLHCLPAHRDEEITSDVLDGPQSVILQQAENRLYAQMAIMEKLIGKKK